MSQSLFAALRDCLDTAEPTDKIAAITALAAAIADGSLSVAEAAEPSEPPEPIRAPGRPPRPALVAPRDLPQRRLGSPDGRAALLHAVAHIEFNAINLALDAAYRFRGMPEQYYRDWISVALDEARHFQMLAQRLQELDSSYGAFDAHNGLWEMAERTADSCLARMALVPRVLEARGLDVTPGMIAKLRQLKDLASVEVLEVILAEEVRHVAIGSHWFAWCCRRESLDPETTFIGLLGGIARRSIQGPFNLSARRAAGFADSEMSLLSALAKAE